MIRRIIFPPSILAVVLTVLAGYLVIGRLMQGGGERYGLYAILLLFGGVVNLVTGCLGIKCGKDAPVTRFIYLRLGEQGSMRFFVISGLVFLAISISLVWLF